MIDETDIDSLASEKWVRILADSCADGVWERGGGACRAEGLPVSAELVSRIKAWQRWYDRDENDWGIFKGDLQAFSAEGLAIARALKRELPDWTVVYFDDDACENAASNAPRIEYEYEIE